MHVIVGLECPYCRFIAIALHIRVFWTIVSMYDGLVMVFGWMGMSRIIRTLFFA